MQRIAANQSNFGSSQSIGATTGGKAEADLRGLGGPTGANGNKTLVLLNGRRIVNHSFDAAAVDLNSIPLNAIDRIEVLRDGASAIYGTDAIGGVINFILKRDYQGFEVSAQTQQPQHKGGGADPRVNATLGWGSLATNGFNFMGSIDFRNQHVLAAAERKFSETGIIRGAVTGGTSGTSFPGDLNGFEPTLPTCSPPSSIPNQAGTGCRYDFSRDVDIIPQNQQATDPGQGQLRDHARPRGVGRIPACQEPADLARRAGADQPPDPDHRARSSRPAPADGRRDSGPEQSRRRRTSPAAWPTGGRCRPASGPAATTPPPTRLLAELAGNFAGGWDYKAGLGTSRNTSVASVSKGYVNDGLIAAGRLQRRHQSVRSADRRPARRRSTPPRSASRR